MATAPPVLSAAIARPVLSTAIAPPVEGHVQASSGKLDILLLCLLSICILCILFPDCADAVMRFCMITVPNPPDVNI
jgi:hypothetical protein